MANQVEPTLINPANPAEGYYYVNDSGVRFTSVNGQPWTEAPAAAPAPAPEPTPPAPAPAPVAPVAPSPVSAPTAPQSVPQLGVAPGPVAAAPVGAAPGSFTQTMASVVGTGSGSIMDVLNEDLSGVNDSVGRLIPPGTMVEAMIASIEGKASKSSDGQNLNIELVVTFPAEYAGIRMYENIKMTGENADKSRWKWKRLARVTGFLSNDETRVTAKDIQDFKHKVIRFAVIQDSYDNGNGARTNNKVSGTYEAAYETPGLQGGNPNAAQPSAPSLPGPVTTPGMPSAPGMPAATVAPAAAPAVAPVSAPVAPVAPVLPTAPVAPAAVPGAPTAPPDFGQPATAPAPPAMPPIGQA